LSIWAQALRLPGGTGEPGRPGPAAEGEGEATRAMGLLHQAVAMGYRSHEAYRNEDALDPLRGREDFRLMMMDLAFRAEPFSKDTDAGR